MSDYEELSKSDYVELSMLELERDAKRRVREVLPPGSPLALTPFRQLLEDHELCRDLTGQIKLRDDRIKELEWEVATLQERLEHGE